MRPAKATIKIFLPNMNAYQGEALRILRKGGNVNDGTYLKLDLPCYVQKVCEMSGEGVIR